MANGKRVGRVVQAGVLASVTSGCGLTAMQVRERDLCYERAEQTAQARVDAECRGSFVECLAADDILSELRRAQQACP